MVLSGAIGVLGSADSGHPHRSSPERPCTNAHSSHHYMHADIDHLCISLHPCRKRGPLPHGCG